MKTLLACLVVVAIAIFATALFADEKKTVAVTVDATQRVTLIADPDHSSVEFRTRHWQIVDLIGWFEDFDIEVEVTDGNFEDASVVGRIRPASARMPNMDMAGNLRGMFDVERYPEVVFRSSVVERTGDNNLSFVG